MHFTVTQAVQKSMLEHVSDVLCSSQLVCGFRLLHGLS